MILRFSESSSLKGVSSTVQESIETNALTMSDFYRAMALAVEATDWDLRSDGSEVALQDFEIEIPEQGF
jgi:cytidylate kinase